MAFAHNPSGRGRKPAKQRQQQRRAFLEALEDRSMMATWTGGGVAGVWNDDANWGGVAGATPDIGGETAVFDNTSGAGQSIAITGPITIDSLTFSGAAAGFTINGGANINFGSVVHSSTGSNTLAGNNVAFTGTTTVNAGVLTAVATATSNPLGTSAVVLNGGRLNINSTTTTPNAIGHAGYHINNDIVALNIDRNSGLIGYGDPTTFTTFEGLGLLTNGPGNRGLDFDNDADFQAVNATIKDDSPADGKVIVNADNYSNLFIGTFTVPGAGAQTWGFRNAGDDDSGAIWVDLDQDGVFESSATGLVDNSPEQLSWENGTKRNVTLQGGQSYQIAVMHREGGGGSGIDVRHYRSRQCGTDHQAGGCRPSWLVEFRQSDGSRVGEQRHGQQ